VFNPYNPPEILPFTGERVVPWADGMKHWAWVMDHHVERYRWALQQVVSKDVIELGCGAGYGTFMLSWLARIIAGWDISQEAIDFANKYFKSDNLFFHVADITNPPYGYAPADVYVCFECLEHIDNPKRVMELAKETAELNGKEAVFLGSMPVNDPGQFHKRAYSKQDIINLVNSVGTAEFYYQGEDGDITPTWDWQPNQDPKYVLWRLEL
jgi:SAM-dependent methyltransferase